MTKNRAAPLSVSVHPASDLPAPQSLPAGYSINPTVSREAERALLEPEFDRWERAYERRFPGAAPGSLFGIGHAGEIVAIAYAARDNEIGLPGYGQLHYPVVHPGHRRRGLYRALFVAGGERIVGWGLSGLVMVAVSDGELPVAVYERWGGIRIGVLKPRRGLRRRLPLPRDPHASLRQRAVVALREHGADRGAGRP